MILRYLVILAFFAMRSFADENGDEIRQIPHELNALILKRDSEQEKLEEQFEAAVERLKKSYMERGDLDGANAANALIKGKELSLEGEGKLASDPLSGTSWKFLGTKKQVINEFKFLGNGSVSAKHSYPKATWARLDENYVLFRYAPGDAFIVFRRDGDLMSGYHSNGGSARYLRKQ